MVDEKVFCGVLEYRGAGKGLEEGRRRGGREEAVSICKYLGK